MLLQLFKDGKEIPATDGIMYTDGRLNKENIANRVRQRNKKFELNFPDKVSDAFAIYKGNKVRNGYGAIYKVVNPLKQIPVETLSIQDKFRKTLLIMKITKACRYTFEYEDSGVLDKLDTLGIKNSKPLKEMTLANLRILAGEIFDIFKAYRDKVKESNPDSEMIDSHFDTYYKPFINLLQVKD